MKIVILEVLEKHFLIRFLYGDLLLYFIYGMILFFLWYLSNAIMLMHLTWYIPLLVCFSCIFITEYKYYTYKIELDGNILKMRTHLWSKKKDLEFDLSNLAIYYSKYGIFKSVKYEILFYDGINTPLWKTGKILHRINPQSSIFIKDWTQEKVKELYDRLEEIQKEVLEN